MQVASDRASPSSAKADVPPALLELDRISKTYPTRDGGTVHAVDRVSCSLDAGEFVALLGPSGCGKSTLLTMIAGLLAPSEGSITYRGQALAGPHADFGIVFQDAVLFPWRTVQQNVELPGEIAGTLPARAATPFVRAAAYRRPCGLRTQTAQRTLRRHATARSPSHARSCYAPR